MHDSKVYYMNDEEAREPFANLSLRKQEAMIRKAEAILKRYGIERKPLVYTADPDLALGLLAEPRATVYLDRAQDAAHRHLILSTAPLDHPHQTAE